MKRIQTYTAILGSAFLLLLSTNVQGRGLSEAQRQKESDLLNIEQEYQKYVDQWREGSTAGVQEGHLDRLARMKAHIESELQSFGESQEFTQEMEKKIKEVQKKMNTLSGQLMNLDLSIDMAKREKNVVHLHLMKRVADLKNLENELAFLEAERASHARAILQFFPLLQVENARYQTSPSTTTLLTTLLSSRSFSQGFVDQQHASFVEESGRKLFFLLEKSYIDLKNLRESVSKESKELSELYGEKKKQQSRLRQQIAFKKMLEKQSAKNKDAFQELLEESRQQMEESAVSIARLQEDKEFLQEKFDILQGEYRESQWREKKQRIEQERENEQRYAFGEKFLQEEKKKSLLWPVLPKRGISAYYLDKGYEGVFHTAHHAIDIPIPQNTPIRAPALGYVYKVTDNGMGYSSLTLMHRNNIMTVYGHIPSFTVKKGDLVQPGDIIAHSGGTPGTKGAGLMTTGAHLHFEVFEDGKHVDPLKYLPLHFLKKEKISQEIQKRYWP